ncbi:MAG: rhodanese-like domain-containing protein [Polyangiaceae bacterium]|jgi:rhodanese-related sulfurtransferase|nr:rhodanese-like domain-containing protein [Polyangiaceae bacterium]
MRMISALSVAAAMALALVGCGSEKQGTSSSGSASAHAEEKLAELTVDEVEARIAKNDGKFFVYDNNQKAMFDDGHLPGAKHLPIDDIKESDLAPDKNAELLFYCSNEK